MNVAAFVAVAVLLAVGTSLAWRAGGPAAAPRDPSTPVRLTVLAYLTFYGLGSLILIATGDSDGPGPLLAGAGLMAFGAGAWLASRFLGKSPPRAHAATTTPAVIHRTFRPWVVVGLAAAGIVALAVLIAQHGIPLLAGDPQVSRPGFAGPLFDLFRWLVPPAALVAFALALSTGQARDRWIAAAALVGVGGLEIALASRALPLELTIEALLVAWWAGRRLSVRAAASLAATALVLFVGVQLLRIGPEGGFSGPPDIAAFAVRRTIDRVLLIHPLTLDLVATQIPAREPYFGGATYVRRLSILLGYEERPVLGYWIYERLFPGESGGFAAPGVVGEAWANGGPILTILIMIGLGVLAQVIGRRLATLPRRPTSIAFAALVSVAIARSYATSLNGLLLTLAVATAWWLLTTPRDQWVDLAADGRIDPVVPQPHQP